MPCPVRPESTLKRLQGNLHEKSPWASGDIAEEARQRDATESKQTMQREARITKIIPIKLYILSLSIISTVAIILTRSNIEGRERKTKSIAGRKKS